MKILLSLLIVSVSAWALAKPEIKGEWIQGGLLFGQTAPKNKVVIFDRDVYVSEKGEFVFGLGRDTPKQVELSIIHPEGKKESYSFNVTQREYKTQKIEGVAKKYVAPPPEVSKRIKEENAAVWRARQTKTTFRYFADPFQWPLIGPITGVYGSQRIFNGVPKRPHYGLDIAGPVGARVVSPARGIVTLAHNDMYYSGGTLIIDHGQGVTSTFIHLHKVLVKVGDEISQGQEIAEVGASGRVTGPHLDWRINWYNQRLDPYLLMSPMPEEAKGDAK